MTTAPLPAAPRSFLLCLSIIALTGAAPMTFAEQAQTMNAPRPPQPPPPPADTWPTGSGAYGYWGDDPVEQRKADLSKITALLTDVNQRLIDTGKIEPMPADASDPDRWLNNMRDNNDSGPATVTTKCAWIVQAELAQLSSNDLPPGYSLVWLEYNVPFLYHSVIAIYGPDGSMIGYVDPWRQNFVPQYDPMWDPSVWTPGVDWVIVPRFRLSGPAVTAN